MKNAIKISKDGKGASEAPPASKLPLHGESPDPHPGKSAESLGIMDIRLEISA
jgi:hypothetical protein